METPENMEISEKLALLNGRLAGFGKVAVAFSGGVDSTFLLAAALEELGASSALAVTVSSPMAPSFEMRRAGWFCEDAGVRQIVVEANPLDLEAVRENSVERCYHCKRHIFSLAAAAAKAEGFGVLADGSNADDDADFRPGARARDELGVESPLRDARMTKADIRALSREMGLPSWDAPSCACLATRVPYGTPLDADELARVDRAEDFLRSLDFEQVRVRAHGRLARIEVAPVQVARLSEPAMRIEVTAALKRLGFAYVCADLEGFRTGSMSEQALGGKNGQ